MFKSVEELVRTATERNIPISEVMIEQEVHVRRSTREEVVAMMERNLEVMEEAVERAMQGVTSVTGLTGNDAVLMQDYVRSGKSPASDLPNRT